MYNTPEWLMIATECVYVCLLWSKYYRNVEAESGVHNLRQIALKNLPWMVSQPWRRGFSPVFFFHSSVALAGTELQTRNPILSFQIASL